MANALILVKFIGEFLPAVMSSVSLFFLMRSGFKLELAQTIEILTLFRQSKEPLE